MPKQNRDTSPPPTKRVLRARKKVDYGRIEKTYDHCSFISTKKPKARIININVANGRMRAAPPLTSWPFPGMHQAVTYYPDLNNAEGWNTRRGDEIFMPFACLNVKGEAVWQGLEQEVAGLSADPAACAHFDQIAISMRASQKSSDITECVGEAAAAIYVLEQHPGYKMTWGYYIHSGTGIDQIWEKPNNAGGTDFLIVEAKGPGASVNSSVFVPPGYSQMDEGWVANHLYSMSNNGRAAGQRIVNALGLQFVNAYPNFSGAIKSYYGLAQTSRHKQSASRVYGTVVEAQWLSDGRLGHNHSTWVRYFT
ncbi:hypothetical protein [Dyella choica]|uniref:Uncharacterized protein n=1 Tax=Dyella choica TaxID=1927959 RepID=A0A432M848_9GAMM|nr:hypothetical protein [Dyella choica]RUL77713.1 hypothetical protein EKH80_07535 [Dyella choica]